MIYQLVAETATCLRSLTHNKPNRRISVLSAAFEPAIPAVKRLQNYALNRTATEMGKNVNLGQGFPQSTSIFPLSAFRPMFHPCFIHPLSSLQNSTLCKTKWPRTCNTKARSQNHFYREKATILTYLCACT